MGASPGILSWGTGGTGGGGGGGRQPPIVVNYTTLLTLINTNGLTPGQSYQFAMTTAHYIQFSGPLGSEQIHVGTPEQLVVIASSANTLQPQAYSLSYPQDIIYYQAVFADRDYDAVLGQSTGVIYYREDYQFDVSLSNSRDYDLRNVIFRRWETNSGSGVFDSITDTGFAYRDSNAFSVGSGLCAGTKISSPGQSAPYIGYPYQLDNFVMDSSTGKGYMLIKCFAVGSTFLNGCTLFDVAFCINSTIYADASSYKGVVFEGNVIHTNLEHCEIVELKNSELDGISYCNMNRLYNTLIPSGVYYYNTINQVDSDFTPTVTNNIIGLMAGNTCKEIIDNVSTHIENNNLPGANAIISTNNVQQITGNTCNAGNLIGIRGNTGAFIVSNSMANFGIYNNTVQRIQNNTMRGDIFRNAGYIIDSNNVSQISYNNVTVISTNTTLLVGSINNNTGQSISFNNTRGGAISGNVVNRIDTNVNTNSSDMPIINNVGYLINENDIDYDISFNLCNQIYQNTNGGYIRNNQCASISQNSNLGRIYENICTLLDRNLSGIGNIFGNTVYYISDNDKNSGGPYDIQWNNGQNITKCKLTGMLLNNNIIRVHESTITAQIQSHTFVAAVANVLINPTAAMQSGIQTQSVYDVGTAKLVEMIITSGVISFVNIN